MQSAMSKKGQEATPSEGSPMAKPKPMIPAKARPIDLVMHSPLSARDLRDPVDPENADEERGGQTGSWKHVQWKQ